jgi:hypothetical protein
MESKVNTPANIKGNGDAAIQCDTFENDSMVAPPLCMIFSDNGVDTDGNTLSRSPWFSPCDLFSECEPTSD